MSLLYMVNIDGRITSDDASLKKNGIYTMDNIERSQIQVL